MARLSRARQAIDRRWKAGAITKRARAAGKDPARVYAGLKAWETRTRRVEHAARVHGQKARERTERQLSPARKAARTRDARRIEDVSPEPLSRARGGRESLDDYLEDYDSDDYDEYDVETSPDYEDQPS